MQLYTPFLYHCVQKSGLVDPDAADVVQDVFVVLLEKLPTFHYEQNGSFRAWLRTVTVNKCRERFRKRRDVAVGGSEAGLIDGLEIPDQNSLWEVEYRHQLVARAMEIMQSDFEPTTWKACWQTTVESQPAAEVAAALSITINAVYVARSRVLRRLREELRELLDD